MFSKAKNLSSIILSAVKISTSSSSSTSSADATLKHFVSSLDISSSPATVEAICKRSNKSKKAASRSKKSPLKPTRDFELSSLKLDSESDSGGTDLNSGSSIDSQGNSYEKSLDNVLNIPSSDKVLNIPWISSKSHNIELYRKEMARERKQKWVFKDTQHYRFEKIVNTTVQKLGTEGTIELFGKLGRENGVKEYNALIRLCIDNARKCEDIEASLNLIEKAFQLLTAMKEKGFQLEERTYGPFFMYFIDMGMVAEFLFLYGVIKGGNPSSLSRLGYYEMLLWIRVNNEEKIQELCNCIAVDDGEDNSNLQGNYLLAFCESGRTTELLRQLEIIDITKVSSVDHVASIFKSLGKLLLESFVEKFILACKTCDHGAENISYFIFSYVISMPNLAVEDLFLKFKDLHAKLEVTPSSVSYEKLITFCCDSLKVHVALDIVDEMCEAGLTLTMETLHSILHASDESCEFNLVHRIYSVICRHNLKPNNETFRSMIHLSVKMKDFDGAYGMLNDLEKMNLMPTASIYNAIMAGYFREKNIYGGLMVLKQMELADVKPDAQTYSYLIGNCNSEEDIVKYYEELKLSGVQVTKHIFMALINAYTTCGQFEKAKQMVLDKAVPAKSLNEIKSVLVSALASHGQMSDALDVYEEIKQAGCNLEPKAIISLIEHCQSGGELSRLLQLLEELNDPDYWVDGCCRIVLYAVRYKHLSSAIDLLKQLKDKYCDDELAIEAMCDEIFCQIAETEPTDLQIGMEFLEAIKEELGLQPTRKGLDFLLGACVNAKDLANSRLVWKEYKATSLPYNILSYLRMYQALLASGDHISAANMLRKIPKDDPHVRSVIEAFQIAYSKSTTIKNKKKRRMKIKRRTRSKNEKNVG